VSTFFILLRPSRHSRSRTRFSRSRTLDVPTTSSSAWTGPCPPSSIRRFQAKSCDGETPACRATKDTLIPGCIASSTRRTFSAVDHRRRRCTEVITSTREYGPSGAFDVVVLIGGCLCLIGYAPGRSKRGALHCAPRSRSHISYGNVRYARFRRAQAVPTVQKFGGPPVWGLRGHEMAFARYRTVDRPRSGLVGPSM